LVADGKPKSDDQHSQRLASEPIGDEEDSHRRSLFCNLF
jgi:hypothetical protein